MQANPTLMIANMPNVSRLVQRLQAISRIIDREGKNPRASASRIHKLHRVATAVRQRLAASIALTVQRRRKRLHDQRYKQH